MEYRYLTITREKHIATVMLNRPEKLNTLNVDMMNEIIQVADELQQDEQTRVVIFTGAGRHFSGGVDLTDIRQIKVMTEGSLLMKSRYLKIGPKLIRAVYEISQITIAALNGAALGGGACIAAACDFRIGAEDCRVGYPEVNLGMNLSWGALPMCVNLIGPSRAKRMVILAQQENARTLLDWGFLDEVVPGDQLLFRAVEMAETYAAQPPVAAQMVKQSVNALSSSLQQAIMHMDTDQYLLAAHSEDFAERIQAFFKK
ncbi:MAG: enoyl-CoA hydratase/isomerase family protein [Desulfobacterales bacterium]